MVLFAFVVAIPQSYRIKLEDDSDAGNEDSFRGGNGGDGDGTSIKFRLRIAE